MQTRRSVMVGLAGTAFAASLPGRSFAQSLCEVWPQTLLWDIKHALWGSTSGEYEDCVYMIGGPWCPVCRRSVNEYFDGKLKFELRFVPFDAVQMKHRRQMADIVLNNVDGIKRTFVDNTPAPSFPPQVEKLIHDANFIAAEGFKPRFKNLASPTFVYDDGEGAAIFKGYKPWKDFTGSLQSMGSEITDFSQELDRMLSEERKLDSAALVGFRRTTAIHALPHSASASLGCFGTQQYEAVAEVRYQDTDWIKILALFSTQDEPVYGYVAASDMVFA